ncbi:MAG: hypothetical protein JWM42_2599, partial [Burkholderia sp.]|nr:hypothetical protein [Burkholderia sp.]
QDDSPPGGYFTYVNTSVVKEGHKNRVGVYQVGHESSVFLGSGGEMENDAVDGQDPARAVHILPDIVDCRRGQGIRPAHGI